LSSHHYAELMWLFVSSWTTNCEPVSEMYFSIVCLEKRYKYWSIVSQILIQDIVLKMCLDTTCEIHFLYLGYLSRYFISDTIQHCM